MYAHKNGCYFRKLARTDLASLKGLKADSWTTTHKSTFVNDDDQENWFNSIPANASHFICLRDDKGKIFDRNVHEQPVRGSALKCKVGLLSITNQDQVSRSAMIGGSIFGDHRGTDWSKKAWEAGTDFAFEMFNLHRIDGEVLENNVAALYLDVRLGYVIEGKRRKAVYKSGTYLDSYVVGLLREEWEATAKSRWGGICNLDFRNRFASKVLERSGVEVPSYCLEEILPAAEVPPCQINVQLDEFLISKEDSQAVS